MWKHDLLQCHSCVLHWRVRLQTFASAVIFCSKPGLSYCVSFPRQYLFLLLCGPIPFEQTIVNRSEWLKLYACRFNNAEKVIYIDQPFPNLLSWHGRIWEITGKPQRREEQLMVDREISWTRRDPSERIENSAELVRRMVPSLPSLISYMFSYMVYMCFACPSSNSDNSVILNMSRSTKHFPCSWSSSRPLPASRIIWLHQRQYCCPCSNVLYDGTYAHIHAIQIHAYIFLHTSNTAQGGSVSKIGNL